MSKEKELIEQVAQLEASLKAEKEISLELSENCLKLEKANQEQGSLKAALIEELEKTKSELSEVLQANQELGSSKEALMEQLEKNQSELADALEANKLLMKTMEDLSAMPAEAAKPTETTSTDLAALSFTKEGVKYGFNFAKITHKKMPVSADEIAVDEKLQEELIALKSGILKVL